MDSKIVFPYAVWDLAESPFFLGIVNITPDSFSDGGQFLKLKDALKQIELHLNEGAHAIDIGAESTRPQSQEIDIEEEWLRLEPILKELHQFKTLVWSLDTRKSEIVRRAKDYGLSLVNDVSGGRYDPNIFFETKAASAKYVLMHSRATPQNMMHFTEYQDLLMNIENELQIQMDLALSSGLPESEIIIDPGFGFAKSIPQNWELLENLSFFRREESPFFHRPLLIGLSRKRFIRDNLGEDREAIEHKSALASSLAAKKGAHILRVHNVKLCKTYINRNDG